MSVIELKRPVGIRKRRINYYLTITKMEKALKQTALVLILIVVGYGIQSYETDDPNVSYFRKDEYTQIVENTSAVSAVNELYVASDGDIESLARMLHTTPSVINRIRDGITNPTQNFESSCKEILIYYRINDASFNKLRFAMDDEYSWYDSVLDFPSFYPWWFWTVNIVLVIVLMFAASYAIWPIIAELLIFFVAWIAMLICSPGQMKDSHTNSIDPVMEQTI